MNFQPKFVFLLSALMFGVAWLLPNHYAPWTSFYNELPAALGLLTLAVALYMSRQRVSLPKPALFAGLLAIVPLVQFASGLIDFFGDAVMAACFLTAFSLSILLGYNLARVWGARFVDVFAWVVLIGAFISVVLALHQWLGLQQLGIWLMDMPPNGRPYANLAQPNNLATLFCLGLAGAIYLRERGHFGLVVLSLFGVLLLAGLAMTRSRTAIFIVIVIAVWLFWGRRRFRLKCSPIEVVAAVLVFSVLWAGWSVLSDWLYLSATGTLVRVQSTFGGGLRLVLWQQLLEALSRQPFAGYGWNQVSVAQMAVVADYPPSSPIEYAHNFIIDLLVWNGLALGGIILVAVGWWLISVIRKVSSLQAWFALLLVLVVLTHGMFEFPYAYLFFLLPVGLCVGIIGQQQQAAVLRIPRLAYALMVSMGVGVMGWVVVDYMAIETDYRLMRFESMGIERRLPQTVAPHVVLLTQQQEFIKFARTQASEGMSEAELQWMQKVAHRYSSPPALMRYALALGLNHRYESATLELQRLKHIHPAVGFDEVYNNWTSLVDQYPQLAKVVFPSQ